MDETSDWTAWCCLEPKGTIPKEHKKHFGIYRIRIADASGCAIRLGRMLKCDESGVVYIGRSGVQKTRAVGVRLKEWLRRYHSGAETYDCVKSTLPHDHSLQVSALYLPANEVKAKEAEEINKYLKRFGEPPPFNSNIPGKE